MKSNDWKQPEDWKYNQNETNKRKYLLILIIKGSNYGMIILT